MLPLATQVRKAIWDAVNPHTGKRRIDEAFPIELRETTRDNEMMIRFRNGSTWQALGSDNFQASIGSTPAGIVYSEWAQSNPASKAYLRPILLENKGWQIFITTPRGKNHAYKTFKSAQKDSAAFAQLLTVDQTSIFTKPELESELRSFMDEYGQEQGRALFKQEYYCSFDAAIMGAIYGTEMAFLDEGNRIGDFGYDESMPVFTVWDLGWTDDTAIWFFQVNHGEIHVIDYYAQSAEPIEHYAKLIKGKPYRYGGHWVPHDAVPKTLAANGRSILQQLWDLGIKAKVVPNLSLQDGIQASRKTLPHCWFHAETCEEGIECLRQYQREWDDDRKCFRDKPLHDWTSHAADAFRYLSLVWQNPKVEEPKPGARFLHQMTANEIFWGSKDGPAPRG